MIASAISLDKLVEQGLANNSLIKKNNLEVELTRLKKDENKASKYGEIDITGSYTHYNLPRTLAPLTPIAIQQNSDIATTQDLFSTGIQYSVPLFTGGALDREVDISSISQKIMQSKKRLDREQLIYNIRSLYLSALSLQDIIKSQRKYLMSLYSLHKIIKKGVDIGRNGEIEILKSKAILQESKGQLEVSKSSLNMIRSNLSSITHITKINNIEAPKRKIIVKNISTNFKKLDDLERFKMQDLEIEKSEKRVFKAKAINKPQVSLNSYIGYNYDIDQIDLIESEQLWQVGVNAKLRVFDFGKTSARVQQAKIAKLKAVTKKIEIDEKFKNLIAKAQLEIEIAFIEYETNLSTLNLLKETQRIEEAKYSAEVITLNELLLAKSKTQLAKSKLIQSKYKYQNGIYYLDYLRERGDI